VLAKDQANNEEDSNDNKKPELPAWLTKEREIRIMSIGYLGEPRGEWHAPFDCQCSKCWTSRHPGLVQFPA